MGASAVAPPWQHGIARSTLREVSMTPRSRDHRGPGTAAALAGLVLLAAGCGHTVRPAIPYQHPGAVFDFRSPPCQAQGPPEEPAPDAVTVRYVGAGGLYIGWRGEAILTGPYFSNAGLLRIGLGFLRWDRRAIRCGLAGMPLGRVGAVIAGHSHYDHIGDLPVIAERIPRARILVNRSGEAVLRPFPELASRVTVLEDEAGRWLDLEDAAGRPLPFRVLALPSEHAPHLDSIRLWSGETRRRCRPWTRRRHGSFKAGTTYALVIDLVEPAGAGGGERAVRYRIYYQDSAAPRDAGLPPEPAPGDPPYDLAVLCAASSHLVAPAAPGRLLRRIAPAHVLVTHYENFFRPWGPERGFVPLLTDHRMACFLGRVEAALGAGGADAGPVGKVCGPSTRPWTIPLVGEWLELRPSHRTEIPCDEEDER